MQYANSLAGPEFAPRQQVWLSYSLRVDVMTPAAVQGTRKTVAEPLL